jgi:DNA-binding MarR family transcriptional regulator
MVEPDVLQEQAQEIVALLGVLRRELRSDPTDDIVRSGLTGPQIACMAHLIRRGPAGLTELSRALGLSHSTMSGIVDRLEARDLVKRLPDDTDGRRRTISVTAKVERYLQVIEQGPVGRVRAALEGAGPSERRAIAQALRLLRDLLERSATSDGTV